MLGTTDLSLVASAALAAAWVTLPSRCRRGPLKGSAEVAWGAATWLRDSNQWLPFCLLLFVCSSSRAFFHAAFALDLLGWEADDWLEAHPSPLQRVALGLALLVWRAEKLDSLLKRVARCVSAARRKNPGVAGVVSGIASDRAAAWGLIRRTALIVVACCGYKSFVRYALPTVALDECMWYALAKLQDFFARKIQPQLPACPFASVPTLIDTVVLPLFDLLHFLPVLLKIMILGLTEYPFVGGWPLLLTFAAFAWTGHNCHVVYVGIVHDIPDAASQIYSSR